MKRLFNFFRDHLIEYFFIALAFVGAFYLALTQGSYADSSHQSTPRYTEKLFNQSVVHKIEVKINPEDLVSLRENPQEKDKYITSVIIDGEEFEDVAFSTRGNGTLKVIAEMPDSNRYSYTLNFRKFNKSRSYYGLDKLSLNSLTADSSYLKDYLAHHLSSASGLDAPFTAYTELYINNELNGLYLAIEGIDKTYLSRTGSSADATLFHPLPYSVDHDRIYRESQTMPEGETGIWEEDIGYNGSNFRYLGDSAADYDAIFENAITKYSKADERLVIDAIRSLEPNENSPPPEQFWDIDSIIDFFVAAAFVPNGDSYLGATSQNYYLKISGGKLSLIPWDFDRAFHIDEPAQSATAENSAIFWPIDSPLLGPPEDDRPLWRLIANNPDYMAKYHARLQQMLDDYLLSGKCRQEFDAAVELIRHYVYSDPTRLSTTDEFEDEVEYLRRFILLRADSIQKQLWDI